jgi:hypothetical protein
MLMDRVWVGTVRQDDRGRVVERVLAMSLRVGSPPVQGAAARDAHLPESGVPSVAPAGLAQEFP